MNSLAGAWVAGGTGTDEYLEVDMWRPWKFTAVHVQGQDGENQWVTSYKILYYEEDNGTWTEYIDGTGQNVSICVIIVYMYHLRHHHENMPI